MASLDLPTTRKPLRLALTLCAFPLFVLVVLTASGPSRDSIAIFGAALLIPWVGILFYVQALTAHINSGLRITYANGLLTLPALPPLILIPFLFYGVLLTRLSIAGQLTLSLAALLAGILVHLCPECVYDLRATPLPDGPLLPRCPEYGRIT